MVIKKNIVLGILITLLLFSVGCSKKVEKDIVQTSTPSVKSVNSSAKPIIYASEKLINLALKNNGDIYSDNKYIGTSYSVEMSPEEQKKIDENLVYFAKPDVKGNILAYRTKLDKEDYKNFKFVGMTIKVLDGNYASFDQEGTQHFETYNPDGTLYSLYFNVAIGNVMEEKIREAERTNANIYIGSELTTVVDGKPQGGHRINAEGKDEEWGVIYKDYDSFIKARQWNSPESFKQFFDKNYYFEKK